MRPDLGGRKNLSYTALGTDPGSRMILYGKNFRAFSIGLMQKMVKRKWSEGTTSPAQCGQHCWSCAGKSTESAQLLCPGWCSLSLHKAGCGIYPWHHRELDAATVALSAEVLSSEYVLLYSSYGSGFLTLRSSPRISPELCGILKHRLFWLEMNVRLIRLLLSSTATASWHLWTACTKQAK